MRQRFDPLNADDIARLEAQRTWVRNHYTEETRDQYDLLEGKLLLLDTILKNRWIAADEKVKLQSLGVVLGDALVQRMGMRWVIIEDEFGRDPAVNLEGTSIRIFALTLISKRIEGGVEDLDVFALFDEACRSVERLKNEGV